MQIHRDAYGRTLRASALVLAGALILSSGCANEPPMTPVPSAAGGFATDTGVYNPPVLSLAEQIIGEIEAAYETRDLEAYARLFDEKHFVFVFDPIDVLDDPDIPPSWPWPDEAAAHRNLFESDLVVGIDLDWESVQNLPVAGQEVLGEPLPPGTREIVVSGVYLAVEMMNPDGGENLLFEVEGDRAHFFVARDTGASALGPSAQWRILRWEDERIDNLAVSERSWGRLKVLFR